MSYELFVPALSPLAGVLLGFLIPDETLWYQFWFVFFAFLGFVLAAFFSGAIFSAVWFVSITLALACSFSVARAHIWPFVLTFAALVFLSSNLSSQILIVAALPSGGMFISSRSWRSLWPLLLVPMIILVVLLL